MYSRSTSGTLTVQQQQQQRESFAFPGMVPARSTEPEVFTFERVPAQATALRSYVPVRPRKRCTRVMYPAKVRMHLPPPEKNQAKRWLVLLCLVVLWQIYTEDVELENTVSSSTSIYASSSTDLQSFGIHEDLQRCSGAGSELGNPAENMCHEAAGVSTESAAQQQPEEVVESGRSFEQGAAGKGYVVALLVYHRLGSDN